MEGELGVAAYDELHTLAVDRATGKPRRPSTTGLQGVEQPIMAGWLHLRTQKTWRKRFVLLFAARLEFHSSKASSEQNAGSGTIVALNDRHFVGDSASRHLKDDRPFSFMVSDFVTTTFLAADTAELRKFWMHAIARTIKKLQAAHAAFDQPAMVGRGVRSPTLVEREYEERLAAYASSIGADVDTLKQKKKSVASSSSASPPMGARLKSSRLLEEAAELEVKRMGHAALQRLFQEEADELERRAAAETDESKSKELEQKRIQIEERAGLEGSVAAEFEDLVAAKKQESAIVAAQEEIDGEVNRRSMRPGARVLSMRAVDVARTLEVEAVQEEQASRFETLAEAASGVFEPPVTKAGEAEAEAMLAERLHIAPVDHTKDVVNDSESPEEVEFVASAVEAAVVRAEEEKSALEKQAEEALAAARAAAAAAANAKSKAHEAVAPVVASSSAAAPASTSSTTTTTTTTTPTPLGSSVQLQLDANALRAQAERNAALAKAQAMQRMLAESRAAVERSKNKTQERMGAKKQPSFSSSSAPSSAASNAVKPEFGGVAPKGTLVDKQVGELVALIRRVGVNRGGQVSLTFGSLAKAWDKEMEAKHHAAAGAGAGADEDDHEAHAATDLVGLLIQAKRGGKVKYAGTQLFRGADDHIVVGLV